MLTDNYILVPSMEKRSDDNDRIWELFGLAVLSILILMMISGNLFSIITIVSSRTLLDSPSYNIVLNLAIADLAIAVTVMPIYVVWEYYDTWPFNKTSCNVLTALDISLSSVSSYTVLLIAIDKYLSITKPLKHHYLMSIKVSRTLILIIWSVFIAYGFISIYGKIAREKYPRRKHSDACIFIMNDLYTLITAVFVFILPFSFLIYSGIKIYMIARKHLLQICQHHVQHTSSPVQTGPEPSSRENNNGAMHFKSLSSSTSIIQSSTDPSATPLQRLVHTCSFTATESTNTGCLPGRMQHTQSTPQVSSPFNNSSIVPEINRRRKLSLWKPFGTAIIVIFFMVLMCGPYWVATCLDTFCDCVSPWIYEDVLAVIYNLNSLVNPFIYIFTDRKYRSHGKKTLKKIFNKCCRTI